MIESVPFFFVIKTPAGLPLTPEPDFCKKVILLLVTVELVVEAVDKVDPDVVAEDFFVIGRQIRRELLAIVLVVAPEEEDDEDTVEETAAKLVEAVAVDEVGLESFVCEAELLAADEVEADEFEVL